MKCERCQVPTKGYELHDYCAQCSKNLCARCMDNGCCGAKPAESGMGADDEDGDEDHSKRFQKDYARAVGQNSVAMGLASPRTLEALAMARECSGGEPMLSIDFRSVETPTGGVTMDLGVIEVSNPLANLRVLLDAQLSPKVTPSSGPLAGCKCDLVAVHDEDGTAELRAPDGAIHRYTVAEMFGREGTQ